MAPESVDKIMKIFYMYIYSYVIWQVYRKVMFIQRYEFRSFLWEDTFAKWFEKRNNVLVTNVLPAVLNKSFMVNDVKRNATKI